MNKVYCYSRAVLCLCYLVFLMFCTLCLPLENLAAASRCFLRKTAWSVSRSLDVSSPASSSAVRKSWNEIMTRTTNHDSKLIVRRVVYAVKIVTCLAAAALKRRCFIPFRAKTAALRTNSQSNFFYLSNFRLLCIRYKP